MKLLRIHPSPLALSLLLAFSAGLGQAKPLLNFKTPIELTLDGHYVITNPDNPDDPNYFCPGLDPATQDTEFDLFGSLHILLTLTEDKSGAVHIHFLAQVQGVIAVGATTGTIYRAVGLTEETGSFSEAHATTDTYVNRLRFVGPGGAESYVEKFTFRITLTPEGAVKAEIMRVEIQCLE